ncbi:UNVERIFIED_CONTAM: hypothetical protein RMT77_016822 [Armadillidium vulgare]
MSLDTKNTTENLKDEDVKDIDSFSQLKKVDDNLKEEIVKVKKRIEEKEALLRKLNLQKKSASQGKDLSELISTWSSICVNALNELYEHLEQTESFPKADLTASNRQLLIQNLGLDSSLIKVDSDNDCYYI